MKRSPSASLHIHTPEQVNVVVVLCVLRVCVGVCGQNIGKQIVTSWVNGVEEDMPPIPLPVLYILKYTNVFNGVDPIYYESRLISLICVEKISIYKARSPVK